MRMVKDHTNPQYNGAKLLTQEAEKLKNGKYKNASIYQTGHSLGGALPSYAVIVMATVPKLSMPLVQQA